jgi:ComF family protein
MPDYRYWKKIWRWLAPPTCALCNSTTAEPMSFCDACERGLPMLGTACACCATALPFGESTLLCGHCQQQPPSFATVRAAFRYEAPIDRLVQDIKYNGRLDWALLLGTRLIPHLAAPAQTIDALVPVPLHYARLRERGYNQSLELARPLARRLQRPLVSGVTRVRATPPQTALDRDDRRRNVRGAFVTTRNFAGMRLAIVDDVLTSGATADALARCLRDAGAASVEVWVVARA